jgi:DUF1680 family protein
MNVFSARCFFVLIMSITAISSNANDTSKVKKFHNPRINLFPLSAVRLHESQFKNIMDLNHEYLLSIDPDRLASWFRREAGLTPKAPPYPFWESEDVWGKGPLAGHIMGFYLSSMAMMFQSTGDQKIIEKLKYTLTELNECQVANRDGYLLATINGRQVFEDVTHLQFTTSNPLINDSWEPVYIMNKIMLGLANVYRRCDLPIAKDIFIKMADWFGISVLDKLNHEQIQKLLVCEHGSINESYIDAYVITGDKKYLNWAAKLNDEDMWVPLSEGKDVLNGWHANTQIPKFTGFENVFQYTGEKKYTDAAKFFWDIVVNKHTWSIGGNSTGEHFFALKEFENRLPLTGGPESCNSVNMLRLTEILYRDYAEPEKIDYYEKVLFNHILSNYDPDSAMCVYYTSMRPGHYKIYGTKYHSFWCCTGTGMESPAKFGQMIYAYDNSSIYVNLFIPSEVKWFEKGVTLTQQTSFPDDGETIFTIKTTKPAAFSIKIRQPKWLAGAAMGLKVNGKKVKLQSKPGGYAEINRVWKNGDKISTNIISKISTETVPGGEQYFSVLYGPIIMAAKVDNHGLTPSDFKHATITVANKKIPMSAAPSFAGSIDDIKSRIQKQSSSAISLVISDPITKSNTTLIPFNRIYYNRYALYFRRFQTGSDYMSFKQREKSFHEFENLLNANVVDKVAAGDNADESAHLMEGVNTNAGGTDKERWRRARDGGYFMYQFTIVPGEKQQVYYSYIPDKNDKIAYDVFANGVLIATVDHSGFDSASVRERVSKAIDLPSSVIKNKNVTVKFQAKWKSHTPQVYDLSIVKVGSSADFNNKFLYLD